MKEKTLTNIKEASVRHAQLLSQAILPSSLSVLKQMKIKRGSKVLCMNCGEGDVVFFLSSLVGNDGHVIGIDGYDENIFTAKQLQAIKNIPNASFYSTDQFEMENSGGYDFIHCRLPIVSFFEAEKLLNFIEAQLVEGGLIFFEIIDFSGFNSVHEHFAFDRFIELFKALIQSYWGKEALSTIMNQLLLCSGFHNVKHHSFAPTFLQGASQQLPSSTLESIMNDLITLKLASKEEVQVLLYELKNFEQKEHSLISLPRIHLISGNKA